MMQEMTSPFHFDSLVWDWSIAIYLFLLGISAGMVTLAIFVKRRLPAEQVAQNSILKATALIAPLSVVIGLLILIIHLTRPWTFWKLMFNYNITSVMSLGVMLFQLYMAVVILWLMGIFREQLMQWVEEFLGSRFSWIRSILNLIAKFEKPLELCALVFSVLLGAYTGFLLSALKTYPMLNNPVLPILFLFSGLSSGLAVAVLSSLVWFKEDPHNESISFLHKMETPIVLMELFLLAAFFIGLAFGDQGKILALNNALFGGFWSYVFWIGIITVGILLPLLFKLVGGKTLIHSKGFNITLCTMSLCGVLFLRFFILYAGQMTTV